MHTYAYINIHIYIYIQLCEYRLGMLYKRTKKISKTEKQDEAKISYNCVRLMFLHLILKNYNLSCKLVFLIKFKILLVGE